MGWLTLLPMTRRHHADGTGNWLCEGGAGRRVLAPGMTWFLRSPLARRQTAPIARAPISSHSTVGLSVASSVVLYCCDFYINLYSPTSGSQIIYKHISAYLYFTQFHLLYQKNFFYNSIFLIGLSINVRPGFYHLEYKNSLKYK